MILRWSEDVVCDVLMSPLFFGGYLETLLVLFLKQCGHFRFFGVFIFTPLLVKSVFKMMFLGRLYFILYSSSCY